MLNENAFILHTNVIVYFSTKYIKNKYFEFEYLKQMIYFHTPNINYSYNLFTTTCRHYYLLPINIIHSKP